MNDVREDEKRIGITGFTLIYTACIIAFPKSVNEVFSKDNVHDHIMKYGGPFLKDYIRITDLVFWCSLYLGMRLVLNFIDNLDLRKYVKAFFFLVLSVSLVYAGNIFCLFL